MLTPYVPFIQSKLINQEFLSYRDVETTRTLLPSLKDTLLTLKGYCWIICNVIPSLANRYNKDFIDG